MTPVYKGLVFDTPICYPKTMLSSNDLQAIEKIVARQIDSAVSPLKRGQEELREEMNRRFDAVDKEVYGAIQEVIGAMGEATDRKIQKLRSDLEPRVAELESIHPQGQHVPA